MFSLAACGEKTTDIAQPTADNIQSTHDTGVQPSTPQKQELIGNMTPDQKYAVNIFLSNFSELSFNDFNADNAGREQLIYFGCLHNSRNHTDGAISISDEEASKYVELDDFVHAFYKVSEDTVDATLDRYFGLGVNHGTAVVPTEYSWQWQFEYNDGYYYFDSGEEGDASKYFSIADTMYDNGDGTYTVNFTTYLSGYSEALSDCYNLTPSQANSNPQIQNKGAGTAVVKPYVYNGTNTYQLISWHNGQ